MQSTCLTGTGCGVPGTTISSYTYTLGTAGNRLSVAELSGRAVNYVYDDLYRLTSESISGTASQDGSISYQYDAVGNRLQRNSTVPAIPATGLLNYDANDRTATDPYDGNGNLLNGGAGSNVYDFENRLVQAGGVKLVYDGNGNRVSETVAGVTTKYLVADQNLTGYAQVLDELQGTAVTRTYSYGLDLISERQTIAGTPTTSFYGYDGHGSVRFLANSTGAITDTYDYDAFGNLISRTGTTPNNYLFAGEQFDPLLGIYYNRARYYDQRAGRFWTMDTYEGDSKSPISLHKYLYTGASPVDYRDRSGNEFDIGSLSIAMTISTTLQGISNILVAGVMSAFRGLPDAVGFGFFFTAGPMEAGPFGGTRNAGPIGGLEIVFEPRSRKWEWEVWGGLEGVPLSIPMPGDAAHLGEKYHWEMGVFGAWYWNVSSSTDFFGIVGGAVQGNFFGIEQSGGTTAMLFGISNDTDFSLFGIGGGSRTFSGGEMSEGLMTGEAVALQDCLTVLNLANASRYMAVNGAGSLAALVINTGSVALWMHRTYGRSN
jgi:RHS repeat-associated protein